MAATTNHPHTHATANTLEFVRNVLDVDVDAARQVNTYTVRAMYDEVGADGFADIVFKTVEQVSLTWDEIEEEGGIAAVNRDLRDCYGV